MRRERGSAETRASGPCLELTAVLGERREKAVGKHTGPHFDSGRDTERCRSGGHEMSQSQEREKKGQR